MNSADTNDVLNRLMAIHSRSLPVYLSYANPWMRCERSRETLAHIVADKKAMAERLGKMILDNDGVVEPAEFPMAFTGFHDLSFDYLLPLLIERQKREIAAIENCTSQLDGAPLAKAAAQEALGLAKGHLESLEELAHEDARTLCTS